MKIFISHQKSDSEMARRVAETLGALGHTYYLDVIDNRLHLNGDDLADYIRAEMGKCECLLAVVSSATRGSSWVPWEIGVATEKNFPLGTYIADNSLPLEFMAKWPVLRSNEHLFNFGIGLAGIGAAVKQNQVMKRMASLDATKSAVREFHESMRKKNQT